MKKLSLKDVKNSLNRDEMRMISGGLVAADNGCCIAYGSGETANWSCGFSVSVF
jgi:hypothetical protein